MPALGQPVVTNPVVPPRIRRLLNVESGLNDGIATPFVILAIALSTAEADGHSGWLLDALSATADRGDRRRRSRARRRIAASPRRPVAHGRRPVSRQLFVLALAASCYLVSVSLGGNGFIAAFVGGLAFGRASRWREESAVRFTEIQGSLLAIGVWVAFGLTLAGQLLTDFWDPVAIVYAVLSLTAIRMVPVAIALAGLRFAPADRPVHRLVRAARPRVDRVPHPRARRPSRRPACDPGPLIPTVVWTVLLSVVLHGLTAGPLAARYGRRTATLPPEAPELAGRRPAAAPARHVVGRDERRTGGLGGLAFGR